MITAQQAYAFNEADQKAFEHEERRIDAEISSPRLSPFGISVRATADLNWRVIDKVKATYTAGGWEITHEYEQRDGCSFWCLNRQKVKDVSTDYYNR